MRRRRSRSCASGPARRRRRPEPSRRPRRPRAPAVAAEEEAEGPARVRAEESADSPDLAAAVGGRNAEGAPASGPRASSSAIRGGGAGQDAAPPPAETEVEESAGAGAGTGESAASATARAIRDGGLAAASAPAVEVAAGSGPDAATGPVASADAPERAPGWFARLGLLARMLRPGGYAAQTARIRAPAEREKERMERELRSSRNEVDELATKLQSTRDEAEYFLAENQEAEVRAGKRKRQLDEANARIAQLEEQLRSLGHTPLPSGWESFVDWCERELGGSLILSPRARREIKGARFADAPLAARCVLWLAGEYRDGRLNGVGASLRIEESGIRNEPCGGDKVPLKWRGENRFADWHLKNGGNTRDPARCLRIYYFWDQETRQVVVASMPAHVRSALT